MEGGALSRYSMVCPIHHFLYYIIFTLKCTLQLITSALFILIVWSNSGTHSLKLISLLKLNTLRITYGIILSVTLTLIAPVLGTSFVHVADVLPPTLLITLLVL